MDACKFGRKAIDAIREKKERTDEMKPEILSQSPSIK